MDNGVKRLWQVVRRAQSGMRPDTRPMQISSPTMADTIFIRIILENAADQNQFEKVISRNAALLRWAEGFDDQGLEYLIWLQREFAAS